MMTTIMVQFSEEQWTLEAMHLASALARNLNSSVVLIYLSLTPNPGLLGWGITPPTLAEERLIESYAAVAEDYGVVCRVQPVQFISLVDALAQTAQLLNASVLFAHIPSSSIPFWQRFQLWSLKIQLGRCQLYTLDNQHIKQTQKPVPAIITHKVK
ncbi:MAG: universal stress protein [Anaerolineales bacterium]|nr:universal stress protein [Anaerolineales bacterium]